jgi:indolepyruvate ferredoxin oxidoreductase
VQPAQVIEFAPREARTLDELVERRVEYLTHYQNAAYAEQYRAFVRRVQMAEEAQTSVNDAGDLPLTNAVARYLFKLMAYKDEYEVARLHTDAAFAVKIQALFEGDIRLRYHLAPPLLSRRNAAGELQKSTFGAWMRPVFGLLAPLKVLRGTPFDPFGYTEERRTERAIIAAYCDAVAAMLPSLSVANVDAAAAFARLPEHIRGFGHVKARHLAAARSQWEALIQRYRAVTEAASRSDRTQAA